MKKIISLALCAAMLLALVFTMSACFGSETTDGGNGGGSSTAKNVKIIDIKLTDEEYAFLMKKDNTALVESFNAYLAEIKDNGTYATIVAKYFEGTGEKVGVAIASGDVVNTAEDFVVVTNCPFEPFEYIGDDGKIYGVDIEIAKGYAEKVGLNLVVKNLPQFDPIFEQVNSGLADIGMAGITVTPERADLYSFSTAYYNASQKIIVPASCTDFDACQTAEDVEAVIAALEGKAIGFQNGTTGNWYVAGDEDWGYAGFANVTPKGYATALEAINDMKNGNIYAVVVDEAPGAAMVKAVNK